MDKRVEGAMNRDGYRDLSRKGIRRRLARRERDEVRMGKELSRRYIGREIDFRDPSLYDIVVPSDSLALDERVEYIGGHLRQLRFKPMPQEPIFPAQPFGSAEAIL
jgi:hypothetical protein